MDGLFATLIHRARLEDTALIGELEDAIWMVEEGDAAGRAWSEQEGYPGYTSYASLDDLPRRASAFAALVRRVEAEAAAFSGRLAWDLGGRMLRVEAMWVNILAGGGVHTGHVHPGSALSGTAYVDVPDGAGQLKLEDPRLAMMMAAPPLSDDAPEERRRFVYVKPRPGDLILWESWLRHEVTAGTAEDPRLSVSFNLSPA